MKKEVQQIILDYLNEEEDFNSSISKLKKEGFHEFQAKFELWYWKRKFEDS